MQGVPGAGAPRPGERVERGNVGHRQHQALRGG